MVFHANFFSIKLTYAKKNILQTIVMINGISFMSNFESFKINEPPCLMELPLENCNLKIYRDQALNPLPH